MIMNDKIYSLKDISRLILPVAEKYAINSIYIFGSYARGSANENSDIDLLIDLEGAHITGAFRTGRAVFGP